MIHWTAYANAARELREARTRLAQWDELARISCERGQSPPPIHDTRTRYTVAFGAMRRVLEEIEKARSEAKLERLHAMNCEERRRLCTR